MKNLYGLKQGLEEEGASVKTQINLSQYPVIVVGDFNDTPYLIHTEKSAKALKILSLIQATVQDLLTEALSCQQVDILYDQLLDCKHLT